MDPVVTIASIFSAEDNLFHNVLDKKLEIRKNKRLFHPYSDHAAMVWIFNQWCTYNETSPHLVSKFCRDMSLRPGRVQIMNRMYITNYSYMHPFNQILHSVERLFLNYIINFAEIRKTFIQQLIQCRMLTKDTYFDNKSDVATKFEHNDELVLGVLYSATQQLIEHRDAGFKNGIMRRGVNELRTQ